MNWAWGLRGLSSNERLVLLALADHADNDGICWPGHAAVSEKTEVPGRTLVRVLKSLEANRLIEVEHRKGGQGKQMTNRYRLDIHDERLAEPAEPGATMAPGEAEKPTAKSAEPTAKTATLELPIVAPGTTKNVRTVSEPSIEPSVRAGAREKPLTVSENRILGITDAMRDRWRRAFPGVDLDAEIAKAEAWLAGPPRRDKSDLARFLGNRFGKAQRDLQASGRAPPGAEAKVCAKCGKPATLRLSDGRWFCREDDPL